LYQNLRTRVNHEYVMVVRVLIVVATSVAILITIVYVEAACRLPDTSRDNSKLCCYRLSLRQQSSNISTLIQCVHPAWHIVYTIYNEQQRTMNNRRPCNWIIGEMRCVAISLDWRVACGENLYQPCEFVYTVAWNQHTPRGPLQTHRETM
jgi:hypothetical protein